MQIRIKLPDGSEKTYDAGVTARQVAEEALQVAASIDIYTNDRITVEEI